MCNNKINAKYLRNIKEEAYQIFEKENNFQALKCIKYFFSFLGKSFSFIFKEKETLFFTILQIICIPLIFYLCLDILKIFPKNSPLISFTIWTLLCIAIIYFSINFFTFCIGASYILNSQKHKSTIASSLQIVCNKISHIWLIFCLDGWWTIKQILLRFFSRKHHKTIFIRTSKDEAIYLSWKISSLGFISSIICGRNIDQAKKDCLSLIKNKKELIQLRLGFSAICWILHILCIISILLFIPKEVPKDVYYVKMYVFMPITISIIFILLIIRPIYIISSFMVYIDYVNKQNIKINLPEKSILWSIIDTVILIATISILIIYHENILELFNIKRYLGVN